MKKQVLWALLLLLLIGLLAGCGRQEQTAEPFPETLSQLAGKRVGIPSGSVSAAGLEENIPNVTILQFESYGDLLAALKSGAVDAIAADEPETMDIFRNNPGLRSIAEPYYTAPNGFVFAKTPFGFKLQSEMNAFLEANKADLEALAQKWLSQTLPRDIPDLSQLAGNTPVLRVATDAECVPFCFVSEGEMAGFEVELLVLFCARNGYGLEFEKMAFGSIIPSITEGVCDIGASCISITEERKEIVAFSQPTVEIPYVVTLLDPEAPQPVYTSFDQLNAPSIRLGVQTGTTFDQLTAQRFPLAQVQMFNNGTDMIQCLSDGKLDAFAMDKLFAENFLHHISGLAIVPELLAPDEYGFAFPKTPEGDRMCAEMNAFLAKCRQDGTLEAVKNQWISDENTPMPDASSLTGERGTILLALESNSPPCCFLRDNQVVGMDMDLIVRFCQEYGYGLEFRDMIFDAVIPSLNGVCNMAACAISITEERKEQVNLTDPYYSGGIVMIVRDQRQQSKVSFLDSLKSSFEKTFLRESRWKLVLSGIAVTVRISVLTALVGTLLGFGLCLLRRMDIKWLNGLLIAYVRILQGTPIVVLLMILFYIVFAKSSLSGQTVAVVAFSLNFAAYVSEIFRAGIESVDRGQTEAGLALGYTKTQTFLRIVLPQAAMQFLPVYKGEFISLVKTTSVVGYIAVQDLTKASDIIRSRTYEAFFPLIATAIIYFLITALLTSVLSALEFKIRPNRSNRSVKGISK